MNKELLDLLEKINAKKDEVKNLANEGKLEEAKKAKDELNVPGGPTNNTPFGMRAPNSL